MARSCGSLIFLNSYSNSSYLDSSYGFPILLVGAFDHQNILLSARIDIYKVFSSFIMSPNIYGRDLQEFLCLRTPALFLLRQAASVSDVIANPCKFSAAVASLMLASHVR